MADRQRPAHRSDLRHLNANRPRRLLHKHERGDALGERFDELALSRARKRLDFLGKGVVVQRVGQGVALCRGAVVTADIKIDHQTLLDLTLPSKNAYHAVHLQAVYVNNVVHRVSDLG